MFASLEEVVAVDGDEDVAVAIDVFEELFEAFEAANKTSDNPFDKCGLSVLCFELDVLNAVPDEFADSDNQ